MGDDRIFTLVYASRATDEMSDAALERILDASRRWNEPRSLTGVLLYSAGQFMQVLEGPERRVRAGLRRIGRDPKHESIRVLLTTQVPVRQFGDWTMGFRRLESAVPARAGSTAFLEEGDAGPSWDSPTPAGVLLDWFRLHAAAGTAPAPPALFTIR